MTLKRLYPPQVEAGTVLWESSGSYMGASVDANLSHMVSECPSGILMVWNPYDSSGAKGWGNNLFFVPRWFNFGSGVCIPLSRQEEDSSPTASCVKYVYVMDELIRGYASNDKGNAKSWVLTKVISV